MTPQLAQQLLFEAKRLVADPKADPDPLLWPMTRQEFFLLITTVAQTDVIDEALATLEKIANGQLAANIPENLKELTRQLEEIEKLKGEARNEAIRKVRTFLVARVLEKERPASPASPRGEPSQSEPQKTEEPLIRARPVAPPPRSTRPPSPQTRQREIEKSKAAQLKPETAGFLIKGIKEVQENPQLLVWHGLPKTAPTELAALFTQNSNIEEAVRVLESSLAEQQEIPTKPEFAPIVDKLDKLIDAQDKPEEKVIAAEVVVLLQQAIDAKSAAGMPPIPKPSIPLPSAPLLSRVITFPIRALGALFKNIGSPISIGIRKTIYALPSLIFPKVTQETPQTPPPPLAKSRAPGGATPKTPHPATAYPPQPETHISRKAIGIYTREAATRSPLGIFSQTLPGSLGGRTVSPVTLRLLAQSQGGGRLFGFEIGKGVPQSFAKTTGAGLGDTTGKIILGAIGAVFLIPMVFSLLSTNSYQSAYLGGVDVEESLYIAATKTTPKTSFKNEELPKDTSFKITVAPKKEKLTNVTISDSFSVSGSGTARLPGNIWTVPEITDPWTQEINITLPETAKDTLVINTLTVTANVEGQPTQKKTTSVVLTIGNPPQDCPSGWPTEHGYVNQGPDGPVSHQGLEAIDIHGNPKGTEIRATHKGVAYPFKDSYDGKDVELIGTCGGKPFSSFYTHLLSINVKSGQEINKGDILGMVDCTGFCYSDHVHYQFGWRGNFQLRMGPPYIPIFVPDGCLGQQGCNVTW